MKIIKSNHDCVQALIEGSEMDVTRTKSGWHARVLNPKGEVIFDGDLDAKTAGDAIAETMRRGRLN